VRRAAVARCRYARPAQRRPTTTGYPVCVTAEHRSGNRYSYRKSIIESVFLQLSGYPVCVPEEKVGYRIGIPAENQFFVCRKPIIVSASLHRTDYPVCTEPDIRSVNASAAESCHVLVERVVNRVAAPAVCVFGMIGNLLTLVVLTRGARLQRTCSSEDFVQHLRPTFTTSWDDLRIKLGNEILR